MKKSIYLVLIVFLLIGRPVFYAQALAEAQPLTLDFGMLKMELDDYEPEMVSVDYSFDTDQMIATIRDKESGEILEVVHVMELKSLHSSNNSTVFLYKDQYTGGVTLRCTASVQVYSSGSFRQINSLNYVNLTIVSGKSEVEIENPSVSCTPYNGSYPDWKLNYSYTCTLKATVAGTVETSLNVQMFKNLGYTVSSSSTTTTYMRQYVNSSGTFSLY